MKTILTKLSHVFVILFSKIFRFLNRILTKCPIWFRAGLPRSRSDLWLPRNPIHLNKDSTASCYNLPDAMPEHVCTPSGKENLEAILKYLFSHGIQFRFTREHHEYPRLHLQCSSERFAAFESNMADYLLPADRIPIPRHIRRKLETRSFCAMTSKAKKCSRKHYCRHIPKTPYDFRPTTSGPNKPNQPRKNNKKSQRMPVNPGSSRFAVRKAG